MPSVKASNNPKTVSDAIEKNDGLDELPHTLETNKEISPSRFDGVVLATFTLMVRFKIVTDILRSMLPLANIH
ncbi:hypothetical protein BLNAU_15352 [Blattamonas nauphoetae]|uniref:Transposase n=1 Tax=Blattamonas nauphoetae TaxID=2049346 RepID=A0ABQ9XCL9_9EUKA|nr:hypothetical protein BLNAU_15352 [Blattamonas nauphoetae]